MDARFPASSSRSPSSGGREVLPPRTGHVNLSSIHTWCVEAPHHAFSPLSLCRVIYSGPDDYLNKPMHLKPLHSWIAP